jgi:hypothetical protein
MLVLKPVSGVEAGLEWALLSFARSKVLKFSKFSYYSSACSS